MSKSFPALLMLSALFLLGCSEKKESAEAPAGDTAMRNTLKSIEQTIRLGCDDDAQCRSIAFGAKPCGGPWKYLLYSTKETDVDTLRKQVETYNEQNRRYNEQSGIVSDCMLATPPKTACLEGMCRAVKAGNTLQ